MYREDLEARAERSYWTDTINIYLRAQHGDKRFVVTDLVLTEFDPDNPVELQPLKFEKETAQRFMDELWNCGLRPSEGTGSAGAMQQAQDHIVTLKRDNDRFHDLLAALIKHEVA